MKTVSAAIVCLALIVCPSASAGLAAGSRSAGDGWVVHVSVVPADLGPLTVSVGPARPAPQGCAHPWLQHDIVFENTGDRRVTFADTRAAAVLGPAGRPVLLASDPGCSYSRVRPIRAACLAYLDFPTVKPHGSVTRTITLWKGLRGMKSLRPGTYVFRKPIRFDVGRHVPPAGTGRSAILEITYRIDAR